MARTPNEEQKNLKRDFILETAHQLFAQKGFHNVTMKDIVEACGISRGGLYLFFSSVDEIFEAVIQKRTISGFSSIREKVNKKEDFLTILNLYLEGHKKRLLNMENTIVMASYEYYSIHQSPQAIQSRLSQIEYIKNFILDILHLGVEQGVIHNVNLEEIAEQYIYLIEGMGVYGMLLTLTEAQIDAQIALMKSILIYREAANVLGRHNC